MSVLLVSADIDLALTIAASAKVVMHVVLLDAAAAAARPSHPQATALRAVIDKGVLVSAHDEALARRGMTPADVIDGAKTVTLDEVADVIADAPGEVVWL